MARDPANTQSLAHTTWNCKYHIVFAPKFRRELIYGKLRTEIGKILRELCNWKGVEIIEAELCPDHVRMYLKIPPKMSVSGVVGFLKGKNSLIIHERHAELRYRYGNRVFWCRGYFVDSVGKNSEKIANYVRNQWRQPKLIRCDRCRRLKERSVPSTLSRR